MREETGRKRRWGEEWGKRCRIRFGEGQEKWPDSQDNEWNSANDRGEEVVGISRTIQRPGIREVPKNQ